MIAFDSYISYILLLWGWSHFNEVWDLWAGEGPFNHDFCQCCPVLPLPLLVVQLEWRSWGGFPDPRLWPRQRGSTTQCPWLPLKQDQTSWLHLATSFTPCYTMSHSFVQTKFGVIDTTTAFTQSHQHIWCGTSAKIYSNGQPTGKQTNMRKDSKGHHEMMGLHWILSCGTGATRF